MEVPTLDVCKTVNVISLKLREVFMQKKGDFEHVSRVSNQFFEFTPSRTSENALLVSRANIMLLTDL